MELLEAIRSRRSVREYRPTPVDREIIDKLLWAAVQAPSAMNQQPWAFGVIKGIEALRQYSERAKAQLLAVMDEMPALARYKDMLSSPNYNLFYDAPALILIYAKPNGLVAEGDCCLAAQNLMLAACDMGLGTCWIGFAHGLFDSPEVKKALGVPEEYRVVAPIALGYPEGQMPPVEKRPPEVIFWR